MAIAPIVIDLLVKGTPQVSQSVRNVADTLARAEKQMARDAEKSARDRQRIADREAKDKVAIWRRMDADVRRVQDAAARETEKNARAQTREVDRAARDKVRIERQAATEIERIQDRARAAARRTIRQEQRDRDQAAANWVRREESAQRAVTVSRERMARAVAGVVGRGVGAGIQRTGSLVSGTANIAAQLGGGFSLADSVMAEKQLRVAAARVSAGTVLAGGAPGTGGEVSTNAVVSRARAIGIENNIEPVKVVAAIDEIKKLTGNVEKSMRLVGGIARLSVATGGDVSEMSGLAANVLAANPNISDDDMQKQLRIFTRQGVVGGVEVPDFAKYGSRMTAGATYFGGNKEQNEAALGALAQTSRQYGGAASAAEATLAAQRFASDLANHADKVKKQTGVDVSDKHGNIRGAEDIMVDLLKFTKGDVTKLKSTTLGERGVKSLVGMGAIYKGAGGGVAGETAVRQEFGKYTTGVTEQEVEEARKRVLAEEQVDIAMMKLRQAVGEQLLPEFMKLIPAIKDATPAIVTIFREGVPVMGEFVTSLAGFVKENKGLISDLAAHPVGTIIAFELTKSFAAAALPALLTRLFSAAFGGVSVPSGGAAGAGGVAPVAALAVGGALTYKGASDVYSDLKGAKFDQGGANSVAGTINSVVHGLTYLNPAMALGQYGMDKATEAIGLPNARTTARQQLGAKDVIDAAAVQKATTQAVSNGVREGVRQGTANSGPAGPARTNSMLDR